MKNLSQFSQNFIREMISSRHPHFQPKDSRIFGEMLVMGRGQKMYKVRLLCSVAAKSKEVLKTNQHTSKLQAKLRGCAKEPQDPTGSSQWLTTGRSEQQSSRL